MKKLILAAILVLCSSVASAKTINVTTQGVSPLNTPAANTTAMNTITLNNPSNDILYIPSGTYLFAKQPGTTYGIKTHGQSLKGDSDTILEATGSDYHLLEVSGSNISIESLKLASTVVPPHYDAPIFSGAQQNYFAGLHMINVGISHINDVYVTQFAIGISVDTNNLNHFNNIWLMRNRIGIYQNAGDPLNQTDNLFSLIYIYGELDGVDSQISQYNAGIWIEGANIGDVWFDNIIVSRYNRGVYANATVGVYKYNLDVRYAFIDQIAEKCIVIQNMNQILFDAIHCSPNCSNWQCVSAEFDNVNDSRIIGNKIHGFLQLNGNNNIIDDNLASRITITGNNNKIGNIITNWQ